LLELTDFAFDDMVVLDFESGLQLEHLEVWHVSELLFFLLFYLLQHHLREGFVLHCYYRMLY